MEFNSSPMTSSRPYLLRAMYEWLQDNDQTPYIMVDAKFPGTQVPESYIQDGRIIFNIQSSAAAKLNITNEELSFRAKFSGLEHLVLVPIQAVSAIYSFENGRGMVFGDDDATGGPSTVPPKPTAKNQPAVEKTSSKPSLKLVK